VLVLQNDILFGGTVQTEIDGPDLRDTRELTGLTFDCLFAPLLFRWCPVNVKAALEIVILRN